MIKKEFSNNDLSSDCSKADDISELRSTKKPVKNVLTPRPFVQESPEEDLPFDSEESYGSTDLVMLQRSFKSILGYSIKQEGHFVYMRSIYAFHKDDVFKFKIESSSGRIKLIPNQYLRQWTVFYDKYIKEMKSLSAFFSAITLDLCNRRTCE